MSVSRAAARGDSGESFQRRAAVKISALSLANQSFDVNLPMHRQTQEGRQIRARDDHRHVRP